MARNRLYNRRCNRKGNIGGIKEMEIKKDYDFADLKQNSWSGAIDTLETIEKNWKEEELMVLLEDTFQDIPTETEVNDFYGLKMILFLNN